MGWLLVATLFAALAAPSGLAAAPPAKTHRKYTHRRRRRRRRVSRPSYQSHPTRERYQQIQQALADKGYFTGPVDGIWGPASVMALQRFQTAQKLPSDGKIDALSLIALGLGPKHKSSVPVTAVAAQPASAPPASHAAPPAVKSQP